MTDRQIELHSGAREDYLESLDWYLDRSRLVAQRFQDEFTRALERIAAHPDLAAADDEGIRWKRLDRFPHVIYYRLNDELTIQVLAVAHSRRHPDYWRRRIE